MQRSFNLGEAIGTGFSNVGQLIGPLAKIIIAYTVVIGVVQGVAQAVGTKLFASQITSKVTINSDGSVTTSSASSMLGMGMGIGYLLLMLVVALFVSVLGYSLYTIIFGYIVGVLRGENPAEPDLSEPIQEISTCLPTWIAAFLPVFACVFVPVLLMAVHPLLGGLAYIVGFVAAIFLSVRWLLTPIVAGVEGLQGREATSRSSELVAGNGLMLVVLLFAMGLVIGIPGLIVSGIATAIFGFLGVVGTIAADVVTTAIVGLIGGIIVATTVSKVYIDLAGTPGGGDGGGTTGGTVPPPPSYEISQG